MARPKVIPPRGLRDIRTSPGRAPGKGFGAAAGAIRERLGSLQVQLGSRARPGPRATRPPRTWVFVPRAPFTRHQGELFVEPVAVPEVELQSERSSVVVLADLPGTREAEIRLAAHDDVLVLSTEPASPDRRRYETEVLLPFPVEPDPVRRAFRNGILEMEFSRKPPGARKGA